MNMIKSLKIAIILLASTAHLTAQDISFKMEITNKKSTEPIVMKVSSNATMIAIEPVNISDKGNMKYLVDNTTNKKYMLVENNGQKMAMSVDPFEAEKALAKTTEPKIVITKEMRTINGYNCNKVIAESDSVISELWMTQEAGLSYNDLYKIFNSTKNTPGVRTGLPAIKNIQGFPIEIISKKKNKEGSVTIKINDISRAKIDPKVFSMDGYKVMDMTKKAGQ